MRLVPASSESPHVRPPHLPRLRRLARRAQRVRPGFAQRRARRAGGGAVAALNALMERAYAGSRPLRSRDPDLARPRPRRAMRRPRRGSTTARPRACATTSSGCASLYAALQAIPRDGLTGMDAVNYDTLAFLLRDRRSTPMTISIMARTAGPSPIASASWAAPIVRSPTSSTASIRSRPRPTPKPISSRLGGFARELDNETGRLRAEYGDGRDPARFRHRQDRCCRWATSPASRRAAIGADHLARPPRRRAQPRRRLGGARRANRRARNLSGDHPPGRDDPRPARQRRP